MADDFPCRRVTLTHPDHHKLLVDGLWNFFQDRHLTDMSILGGAKSFLAHRLIVEVFMSPGKLSEIFDGQHALGGGTVTDFGNQLTFLLEFLYNGTVTVEEDTLECLLATAKELDFTILIDAVEAASALLSDQSQDGAEMTCQPSTEFDLEAQDIVSVHKSPVGFGTESRINSAVTAESVLRTYTRCRRVVIPSSIYEKVAGPEIELGMAIEGILVPEESATVYVLDEQSVEIIPHANTEVVTHASENDDSKKVEDQTDERTGTGSKFPDKLEVGMEVDQQDQKERQSDRVLCSVEEKKFGFPHKCGVCESTFEYPSTLRLHRRVHAKSRSKKSGPNKDGDFEPEAHDKGQTSTQEETEEDPPKPPALSKRKVNRLQSSEQHECDLCLKVFKTKLSLDDHRRIHTGERPFKCEVCNAAFASRSKLSGHCKRSHGDSSDRFKCEECGKSFGKRNLLAIHSRSHSGEKPYSCDVCGRMFAHSGSIKLHKIKHQADPRPFKCQLCPDKQYSQRHMLEVHMRNHTGQRPYQCSFCGKGFTQSANLASHVRTHTQEKPFMCHVCGHSFNQKPALVRHNLTHSGEMNEVCSVCDRRFSHVQNLRDHMRTHTKERPFSCDLCGATFPRRHHRANHVRRHHPS